MQRVLGVDRLEMQGDRRSLRSVVDRFDGVGAVAAGLPLDGLAVAGLVGQQFDLVGHHEGGVEADAELADQLLGDRLRSWRPSVAGAARRSPIWPVCRSGRPPRRGSCRCRCRGWSGCGPSMSASISMCRSDGVDVQILVPERLDPQLVQRVGGVGDQLPQKRVLVGVDRVDHQVKELTGLGLKLQLLDAGTHDTSLRDIADESTGTPIVGVKKPCRAAAHLFGVFPILGRIDTIDFCQPVLQ